MIGFEVTDDGASQALDAIPANLTAAVKKAMVTVGLGLVKHLKEDELHERFTERTGNMNRAVFYRVEDDGKDITAVVGGDLSKAKYFRVQDQGGTIRPVNGPYLAIPVGEALTGKGVGRFTARQLIDDPSRYGYVGTFVHNQVIMGVRRDKSTTPLFALKPSVQLKAVGFMARTLNEKRDWAQGVVEAAVKEGIGG